MNIQTSENNEMLLLMNSNLDQFNKNQETNQQYVQLAPSTEQYVVQAHPTMDLESLGELLNGQPISFEDGELSMIQRDGQQYIVLPSVSMGQVLQTAEVMEPLTNEEVPMSTGYVPTTQYAVQTMETMPVNTVSPVEMDSSSTVVTTQNEQQDVPTSLPVKPKEAETAKQQTYDPVPTIPDSLDITRLIPSLYQNTSQPSAGQGTLQCILCPFAATNEIDLDDHMTEHRNQMTEELFKGCKESFSKKSPKKGKRGRKKKKTCKFIRTTQGAPVKRKGPFTCTICNQQIEKINAFRRHMKEHSNDKNYKCDQCPEMYNIKSNLVLHQAIHAEREEGGGYRCPACQRSFMRIASLKSHLPVHLVDETMICTECGDEFTLKSQLESHMAQHRRDLQKHLSDRTVMPTSEELEEVPADLWLGRRRKFQRNLPKCSFCNKEFQKECQLKRHVLIHTGERPFACNLCDKAFNQKSALQIHLMMHSGKKPYQCPHCPQLYVQRGNLRMHMARVHTKVDNSFRCAVCSCVFKKMGNLNAHITKFHADDQAAAAAAAAAAAGSQPQEEDMLQNQQNLLSLLTEDMITASKDKGASKEDMDVIQQLLRSLDDGEPTTSDSLSVPTSENLLTSELDNDIVQQALQDSGVDNRSSQESNETTNSEVAQHTSQNLVEHNFARPDDFRANGTVIDNASAYTSVEGASEVQPGNGERSLVPSKPRKSVISGVYLRGSGKTAGDQPWKVRNVDGTRWHQCMYCPKEFKKPSDLIRHIRTHTQERPFKCPTCQKSFSVKTSLTAHEKTHAGYKAFKCQICLKSFSTSGSLKVHLRLHTGARPFKCTMCDMSFRTTGHRHNHTMSHLRGRAHKRPHRREKKDLIQLFATNQSNQQTPLQQPIMLVTSEQNGAPSTQPVPAAPAASADEDSEERTHKCITCNKMFKKSCHLKQHLRTHTGEKPYSCTQCGGAFVSPSVLKAHLATHTGVKPFQCLICGQSFSSNNTLKRHMTIHSDARPYMCPYCQKTFKTSPTCKKHIETHRADVTNALQKQAAKEAEMVQEAPAESFATDSIDGDVLFELNDMQEEIRTEEVRSYPDDVMMGGEDAMEFHNNPALQQVNPNAIQNINKLPQFRVNNEDQESSIGPEHIITLVEPAEVTQQSDSVEGTQQHSGITGKVPALFRCTGCSRYFGSQDELTKHNQEERHAPSRSLLCSKCCHCLESQDSLVSHMLAHDSSKRLACPDCSVYFSSEVSLSQHREHHVTLAQRTCAVCDLVFNDHDELKDHVMRHPEDEVREAYRKRDSTVKRGKRKRTGFYLLSDEQSEILERTDPQQNMTLSERILLKAVAEKDVVSNVQAGNQRGRFKEFEMDGPIHANACAYCPKSFRKPSDLTRHERTHTGLKPFKCNVCDKSFCVKSTLVCHQRSHLQRKIYRCHICDMLYSTQSSLKVHMRLHTGAKPHKCPHCPMTFRTSGHRKNHMTVHLVYPNKSKVDRTPQKQQQVEIELPPQVQPPSSLPVSTQAVAMELSGVQSTIATSTQPTVVWPDVTLTLPMESFLNTSLFQDGGDVTSPQGQNLQLATDDPNITLQIDPKLLQQTIQESQQLQQQQQIQQQQQHNMQQQQPQQIQQQQNQQQQQQNQHLQLQAQPNQQQQLMSNVTNQSGNWPAPNVVIQPINSLCVQPLSQSTQDDSVAPSSDEQQRSFPEINIAVPSSLAGITQQIFQSPVVLSDGGNLTELSKASEPLSLNNPSLIQAMQQLLGNLPISGTSPNQPTTYKLHALDGNGNGPELTLTFNSTDLIPNQGQFALPTFSVNNDQILHLDSESSGLIQQVNNDLNNFVAPMSSVAVGQTGQSVIVTHPGSNITRTSVNQ